MTAFLSALDSEVVAAGFRIPDVHVVHVRPGNEPRNGRLGRVRLDPLLRSKMPPSAVGDESQPVREQVARKALVLGVAIALGSWMKTGPGNG